MPEPPLQFGTGWRPEPPSRQDFHLRHEQISELIDKLQSRARRGSRQMPRPSSVDLRRWCSPVKFQGLYNTCTSHVVTSLLEFMQNRAFGCYVPGSRLFLYQVARRMMEEDGDPGVYIRQMMGALVLVGVPPEKYWPYLDTEHTKDPRLETLPDAFCYAVAQDFKAVKYFRIDTLDSKPEEFLDDARLLLATRVPCSVGFRLFMSALKAAKKNPGLISLPETGETDVGGHAVMLAGYDDDKEIPAGSDGGKATRGAFLFKNSWGTGWGAEGYGWLPYQYLLDGLARDSWTLLQSEWVDTDGFDLGWEETLPSPPEEDCAATAGGGGAGSSAGFSLPGGPRGSSGGAAPEGGSGRRVRRPPRPVRGS